MNIRMKAIPALAIASVFALSACQQQAEDRGAETPDVASEVPAEPAVAATPAALGSGIDMSGFDTGVRPQDDFFDYVNGKWVAETPLPADRARWGTFDKLRENAQKDVRALVEEVSAAEDVQSGSATQKIRDFYNAYMDSERPNALGVEAIRAELDEVAAIQSYEDLNRSFASLGVYGVNSPIGLFIFSDLKDPNTNIVYIGEAGITLPDRDYYLKDDEQFVKGRELYRAYVKRLFELAGAEDVAQKVEALFALEYKLAEAHWPKEDNRDPTKIYNPHTPEELAALAPNIQWDVGMEAAQIPAREMYVVQQPSFFEAASAIIADTPLDTCMMDTRFRAKYTDALTPGVGDQERAGLDILTHGDGADVLVAMNPAALKTNLRDVVAGGLRLDRDRVAHEVAAQRTGLDIADLQARFRLHDDRLPAGREAFHAGRDPLL